jgi:hypothetical protein
MNNIKFTIFWKYFVRILTLLTDVSHGFPLSPHECSGLYRVLILSELTFVTAAILACV